MFAGCLPGGGRWPRAVSRAPDTRARGRASSLEPSLCPASTQEGGSTTGSREKSQESWRLTRAWTSSQGRMLNHPTLLGTEGVLERGAFRAKTGNPRQLLSTTGSQLDRGRGHIWLLRKPAWTLVELPSARVPSEPLGSPGREGAGPNSEVTGHAEI